jgi:carbamate kinase
LEADHTVICAGSGGIPVMRNADGNMEGVEAVIDKDRISALLASDLNADALLLLTDVAGIYRDFGSKEQCIVETATPTEIETLELPPGSMGPKAAAAATFIRDGGLRAGIGQLTDARAILDGHAGTRVSPEGQPWE